MVAQRRIWPFWDYFGVNSGPGAVNTSCPAPYVSLTVVYDVCAVFGAVPAVLHGLKVPAIKPSTFLRRRLRSDKMKELSVGHCTGSISQSVAPFTAGCKGESLSHERPVYHAARHRSSDV